MNDLLQNIGAIKGALGTTYEAIKFFDVKPKEREKTKVLKQTLLREYSPYCASCEPNNRSTDTPIAAHIFPLEEGGITTKDNLVFLCKICHSLYDDGHASVDEMTATAKSWRENVFKPLRGIMLARKDAIKLRPTRYRPSLEQFEKIREHALFPIVQRGESKGLLKKLREIKRGAISDEARQAISVKQAELHRRRGALGSLQIAERYLSKIDPKDMPSTLLPRYHYELGYVRKLLGLARKAIRSFRDSYHAATALGDNYSSLEAISAKTLLLGEEVIAARRNRKSGKDVEKILARFDEVIMEARQLPGIVTGDWVVNATFWKANVLLKCGIWVAAFETLDELRQFRNQQDSTTWWTKLAGLNTCGVNGVLLIQRRRNSDEILEGLRLVTRAIVSQLEGKRRRPELIRDFLLGLEEGLRGTTERTGLNRFRVADQIARVRRKIVDCTSFLDTYHKT